MILVLLLKKETQNKVKVLSDPWFIKDFISSESRTERFYIQIS